MIGCARTTFLTVLLHKVLLSRGVGVSAPGAGMGVRDDCPIAIDCYECVGPEAGPCSDPFNKTHPQLRTVRCREACVKWVIRNPSAPSLVMRSCSTNLRLSMRIAQVCMSESSPGSGHICFCKKNRCNSSTKPSPQSLVIAALVFVSLTLSHMIPWPSLKPDDRSMQLHCCAKHLCSSFGTSSAMMGYSISPSNTPGLSHCERHSSDTSCQLQPKALS